MSLYDTLRAVEQGEDTMEHVIDDQKYVWKIHTEFPADDDPIKMEQKYIHVFGDFINGRDGSSDHGVWMQCFWLDYHDGREIVWGWVATIQEGVVCSEPKAWMDKELVE